MKIKQSVINTFDRVGIPYRVLMKDKFKVTVRNRFTGASCETSPLVKFLIHWVYDTNNSYEFGDHYIKVADFDRIRYFVLAEDSNAYSVCLD